VTLPPINIRGLFGECCGLLGWEPEAFWQAQYWECERALRHHRQEQHEQRQFEARKASFMAAHFGAAFRAEDWAPPEPTDLYDADAFTREAKLQEERFEKQEREYLQEEKEALRKMFDLHRPPFAEA
jgi:hypothetical protein